MARYEFDDDDEPRVVIEKHASGVGPFLLGIAIGAGVALLFAPRSGRATRRDIKRRAMRMRRAAEDAVTDVADNVTDKFQDARRKVEDQIDTARQAIDLKRQQVHRAMDAGRAAAREARDELEQRIAETKAAYGAGAAVARNGGSVRDDDDSDEQ
jgi:gas vesicle protein